MTHKTAPGGSILFNRVAQRAHISGLFISTDASEIPYCRIIAAA
jgi:hypothetical protein